MSRGQSRKITLTLLLALGLLRLTRPALEAQPSSTQLSLQPAHVFSGRKQSITLEKCQPYPGEARLTFHQLQGALAAPIASATSRAGILSLTTASLPAPMTLSVRSQAFTQPLALELYPERLLGALHAWALKRGTIVLERSPTLKPLEVALALETIPFQTVLTKEMLQSPVLLISTQLESAKRAKAQGATQIAVVLAEDSPREIALLDRSQSMPVARVPQRVLAQIDESPVARILFRDLCNLLLNTEVPYETLQ